jgi:four helix bundle protein
MPNQTQTQNGKKYDLEERTAKFGEDVIAFLKTVPRDAINIPLISQVVRSATSVGANYMEADGAESKRDFQHKIAICKKEAKETRHWFRMLGKTNPEKMDDCRRLWKEANELALIFSSILRSNKSDEH